MARRVHGTLTADTVETVTVEKATGGSAGHVIENPVHQIKVSFWGGWHPGWLSGGVYLTVDGATDPTVGGEGTYGFAHPTHAEYLDVPDAQSVEVRMITPLNGVQYAVEAL